MSEENLKYCAPIQNSKDSFATTTSISNVAPADQPLMFTEGSAPYYYPTPYVFRIRDVNQQLVQFHPPLAVTDEFRGRPISRIRCPEFSVMLDHTIAILWLCYQQPRPAQQQIKLKNVSAAQIQWAIRFLEGIRGADGRNSTDVRMAIEHLQEVIFAKYNSVADTSSLRHANSMPNIDSATEIMAPSAAASPKKKDEPISVMLNDMLARLYPEKLMHLIAFGGGGETKNNETN